jgi:hypothetical protein
VALERFWRGEESQHLFACEFWFELFTQLGRTSETGASLEIPSVMDFAFILISMKMQTAR